MSKTPNKQKNVNKNLSLVILISHTYRHAVLLYSWRIEGRAEIEQVKPVFGVKHTKKSIEQLSYLLQRAFFPSDCSKTLV